MFVIKIVQVVVIILQINIITNKVHQKNYVLKNVKKIQYNINKTIVNNFIAVNTHLVIKYQDMKKRLMEYVQMFVQTIITKKQQNK